ncbi:MAG: hypothetical protein QXS68_07680 [Candidatus Methanomethylicaceae archaeon]
MRRLGEFEEEKMRFWIRCPVCLEPNWKPEKSVHAFFSLKTFSGYCYRCGSQISIEMINLEEALQLLRYKQKKRTFEDPGDFRDLVDFWSSLPEENEKSCRRATLLEVRRYKSFDVFLMKDPRKIGISEVTGLHFREPFRKDKIISVGKRGLGYSSSISPTKSWRIVEGPYDVLDHQTLCLFGGPPSPFPLYSYEIILCPDGDVWGEEGTPLLKKWIEYGVALKKKGHRVLFEVLPENKDPDEVPADLREVIPLEKVKEKADETLPHIC